jgi:hypothetical protein
LKPFVLIALSLCCLVIPGEVAAKGEVDFSVSPYISTGFGHTKWVMAMTGYVDVDVWGMAKSELEYPLNVLYGGIDLRIGSSPAAFRDWSVSLTVGTDLNDPSNVMKDHDWLTIPGYLNAKISYTESAVKMSSLVGALEGQITLARSNLTRFGLVGGVRYQQFDQNLYGAEGWQLDSALDRFYFNVYQDTLVLTYKITYTMPNIGLFCRLHFNPSSSIELRGAFTIPFVSDEDDHVFRNRLATASGCGMGFIGGLKLRLEPRATAKRLRPFVELAGELLSIDAKPKQTMVWYGDDPLTPDPLEDETGLRITGIPHHITSRQGYITGRVGLTF